MLIPCMAVILLLAGLMSVSEGSHYGWNNRLTAKMWLSVISGPLACWIEFSGHFGTEDRTFYTLASLALVMGSLSHPLWPNKITAAITIFASGLWALLGMALTCVGV